MVCFVGLPYSMCKSLSYSMVIRPPIAKPYFLPLLYKTPRLLYLHLSSSPTPPISLKVQNDSFPFPKANSSLSLSLSLYFLHIILYPITYPFLLPSSTTHILSSLLPSLPPNFFLRSVNNKASKYFYKLASLITVYFD